MMMESDDLKYKEVIDSLRNLRKIQVPNNFETDLMRKINSTQAEKQKSLFDLIFSPVKLIPSAALIATAVILIFVVNNHSTEIEDPFSIEPRMREDLLISKVPITLSSESTDDLKKETEDISTTDKKSLPESKPFEKTTTPSTSIKTEDSQLLIGKNEEEYSQENDELVTSTIPSKDSKSSSIPKPNLNFKQIKLTDSSRIEIAKLKENVHKYLNIEKKVERKTD